MTTLQIQNLTRDELLEGIFEATKKVAQLARPDLYINQKKAAIILDCTPKTVYNYIDNGKLKNHAEGNENPKISLYEVIQLSNKKNKF